MAEEEQLPAVADDLDEETPGYQVPAKRSLNEIQQLDADDESLVKYKEQLLGSAQKIDPPFPDNPANVIVSTMSLVVDGRPDVTLDLKGNLDDVKKNKIIIKEGTQYRLKITFYVQRDIVSGLRYNQKIFRKSIRVDVSKNMMGSYSPQQTEHTYLSPLEDAPSGLISRGSYSVVSIFTDDDKNKYLEWDWSFDIKKDWD